MLSGFAPDRGFPSSASVINTLNSQYFTRLTLFIWFYQKTNCHPSKRFRENNICVGEPGILNRRRRFQVVRHASTLDYLEHPYWRVLKSDPLVDEPLVALLPWPIQFQLQKVELLCTQWYTASYLLSISQSLRMW